MLLEELQSTMKLVVQSGISMFVANNVMGFIETWRKSLYNCKQRVTQSNNIIVNQV